MGYWAKTSASASEADRDGKVRQEFGPAPGEAKEYMHPSGSFSDLGFPGTVPGRVYGYPPSKVQRSSSRQKQVSLPSPAFERSSCQEAWLVSVCSFSGRKKKCIKAASWRPKTFFFSESPPLVCAICFGARGQDLTNGIVLSAGMEHMVCLPVA